jgi:Zn-dependent protease with chaperone function
MKVIKYLNSPNSATETEVNFSKNQLLLNGMSYSYKGTSFDYDSKIDKYKIYLYDGQVLECPNNEELKNFILKNKELEKFNILKVFGFKIGFILPAVVLILALLYASYKVFLPTISKNIAMDISKEKAYSLGKNSLDNLDKTYLHKSKIPIKKQEKLSKYFQEKIKKIKKLPKINIVFRSSEKLGANAFALPNGTIILLDKLVELADNKEQIFSVVAHELGHIYHRHTLRNLIQDSVLVVGLVFVTGDVTSLATVAGLMPVVLLQQHYSREFEIESDKYAYDLLKENEIDPKIFISMLKKIINTKKDKKEEYYYLKSHPNIVEREKLFVK